MMGDILGTQGQLPAQPSLRSQPEVVGAMLHDLGEVRSTDYVDDGIRIAVTLSHRVADQCREWQSTPNVV